MSKSKSRFIIASQDMVDECAEYDTFEEAKETAINDSAGGDPMVVLRIVGQTVLKQAVWEDV